MQELGNEFLATEYRNSDRIIWDNVEIVRRIWDRVLQAEGISADLCVLEGERYRAVLGDNAVERGERWVATEQCVNERMRFLRYGVGQYFREHCDASYHTPDGSQRSFYTLHLYLNDSAQCTATSSSGHLPPSSEAATPTLQGGATTFYSTDLQRRFDVDPKAGRVLIFQHKRLLHAGDEVSAGVKFTVRSDLMYQIEEKVGEERIREGEDERRVP